MMSGRIPHRSARRVRAAKGVRDVTTRALILVVAVALAACSGGGRRESADDALGVQLGGSSTTAAAAPVGLEPATPGESVATMPGEAAPGASSGPSDNGGSPAAAVSPRPAAPAGGPIEIGFYSVAFGEGNPATGFTLGDPAKQSDAIAAWINANGGLGGRPLELVQAGQDNTSSTPIAVQDQAACAKFTEDNHVTAVVTIAISTLGYFECLARRGVIHLYEAFTTPPTAFFGQYPDLISTSFISQDRAAVSLFEGLTRQTYFQDADMKLGLVVRGTSWFKAGASAFTKRASSAGVQPEVTVEICDEAACSNEEAQNAVLKMRTEGVTHAVLLGDVGFVLSWFQAATAQGFSPRYGLYTINTPSLIALSQSPAALVGAVGIGWAPALDVEEAQEPTPNSRDRLCRQIMSDSGQAPKSRLELSQAQYGCAGLFRLKDIFDRNSGATAPEAFRVELESLGCGHESAATFRTCFAPDRHDGADLYIDLAYEAGCRCFRYVGEPRPLSSN